jgi:hypothetical protein
VSSHYTIIIQWSDEDQCYVISLPEWGEYCHNHLHCSKNYTVQAEQEYQRAEQIAAPLRAAGIEPNL